MQQFLKYLAYVLDCIDSNSDEFLQDIVLGEIQKAMSELSVSDLDNLEKLFEAYELYYSREANAVECLIETLNRDDNETGLLTGFFPEVSRLDKQRLANGAKLAILAEVCKLAKERKRELKGQLSPNL